MKSENAVLKSGTACSHLGGVGAAARFEPREMITLAHALSALSQLGDRRSFAARD
jgi:hypothetical protein